MCWFCEQTKSNIFPGRFVTASKLRPLTEFLGCVRISVMENRFPISLRLKCLVVNHLKWQRYNAIEFRWNKPSNAVIVRNFTLGYINHTILSEERHSRDHTRIHMYMSIDCILLPLCQNRKQYNISYKKKGVFQGGQIYHKQARLRLDKDFKKHITLRPIEIPERKTILIYIYIWGENMYICIIYTHIVHIFEYLKTGNRKSHHVPRNMHTHTLFFWWWWWGGGGGGGASFVSLCQQSYDILHAFPSTMSPVPMK